jgi:hypothetical protein
MKVLTDQIEEKFGKVVFKFPVLHLNWETDGCGYIVEREGKRKVLLSDHGNFYVASVEELEQKLAEYTKVKFETKKAITLITKHGKLD